MSRRLNGDLVQEPTKSREYRLPWYRQAVAIQRHLEAIRELSREFIEEEIPDDLDDYDYECLETLAIEVEGMEWVLEMALGSINGNIPGDMYPEWTEEKRERARAMCRPPEPDVKVG